jgi:hypothetical protein
LGLYGNVEGCRGLVRNQKLGLSSQGHRDHYTLVLTSREFMWIGLQPPSCVRHSNTLKQPACFRPRSIPINPSVKAKNFYDLGPNSVNRVQAAGWILENHCDLAATYLIKNVSWCT